MLCCTQSLCDVGVGERRARGAEREPALDKLARRDNESGGGRRVVGGMPGGFDVRVPNKSVCLSVCASACTARYTVCALPPRRAPGPREHRTRRAIQP